MMNESLVAPCGVYCGVCPQMVAHRNNDDRLKEKLAAMYGLKSADIACEGCNSEKPFLFCASCAIKTCVREKEIESCAECEAFPCQTIDSFPVSKFVEKIKWDVGCRREDGKEMWIDKTLAMNTCSGCGTLNHWVAKRCIRCRMHLSERYQD